MSKYWGKFTLVATILALLVAFVGNVEKATGYVGRFFGAISERTAAITMTPRLLRNFFAANVLTRIYDNIACFHGSDAIALDADGIRNDIQVGFYRRLKETCDPEDAVRVSYAYFVFRPIGFDFVGDVSAYKYAGLLSENQGPFIIATLAETDFPAITILELRDGMLKSVDKSEAWTDDGEGDEFVRLSYEMEGDCLVVIAAGNDPRRICAGQREAVPNPLSFDTHYTLSSREDGSIVLSGDGMENVAENAEGGRFTVSMHSDPFARLHLPGQCIAQERISEWSQFFGALRVDLTGGSNDGGETVGDVWCAPSTLIRFTVPDNL